MRRQTEERRLRHGERGARSFIGTGVFVGSGSFVGTGGSFVGVGVGIDANVEAGAGLGVVGRRRHGAPYA